MRPKAKPWLVWKKDYGHWILPAYTQTRRGAKKCSKNSKSPYRNKIHLTAIQETHITRDCNYVVGNYRVITSAEDKNKETGIATWGTAIIMIRGSLQKNITQITRQSSRALRVTSDHAKSKMQIHIISTYAPQMDIRKRQKESIGEIYKNYSIRHARDTS